MQHATLSASGSARWLNCPGSRKAEQGYSDESSPFAQEGTLAHEVADRCLKRGLDADQYLGERLLDQDIPDEMIPYVQEYLDYVRSFEHLNSDLYTEQRVYFSHVVPDGFGTLDAAVMDWETNVCHIFDLKYGKGVQVYTEGNTQAQLYALGMLEMMDYMCQPDGFMIHIVMPRKMTPEPWYVTVDELKEFGNFAARQAGLAMTDDAERIPGDKQCQWCKAKADCTALFDFTQEVISAEFDDLDDLDANRLSLSRKTLVINNMKLVESFMKAVHDSVFTELMDGKAVDGFKLVHGRSTRQWTEDAEDFLKKKLKAKAYNKKLIGIGEAEKLLGKGGCDDVLHKPEGKATLAPDSDKRTAIVLDVTEEFDDLSSD